MEYKYTINDISATVKISKPSLYALIKKNQELISNNSVRRQRKIYYNQTAMDFFISYYQPEQSTEEGKNKLLAEDIDTKATKAEKSLSETSYREEEQKARIDALQVEIKALHEEIDTLKAQLTAKEEERKELLRQNGILCLTLQQEKQEKMLLLPAPKKSFSDKVKSLFKAKPQEN